MQHNPYAAPNQPLGHSPGGWQGGPVANYWMEGRELVAYRGATLPPICLHTGQPVQGEPVHKTLRWSPPWIALLFLIGWPIALIALLITQKSAPLTYYLSEAAKKRRLNGILIASLGSVGSVAVLVTLAVIFEEPLIGILSILTFLIALIVGAVLSRIPVVVKIDDQTIRLKLPMEASAALGGH